MRSKFVELDFHSFEMSHLEAVFARGDRRLAKAILEAWSRGAKFDGWQDIFDFKRWADSFTAGRIDPGFYANRPRPPQEILPWGFIRISAGNGLL